MLTSRQQKKIDAHLAKYPTPAYEHDLCRQERWFPRDRHGAHISTTFQGHPVAELSFCVHKRIEDGLALLEEISVSYGLEINRYTYVEQR